MAQRKRQVLFTKSRRDRHAARQILRCFCGCVSEDLTHIPMGWLAGEEGVSQHSKSVMDGWWEVKKAIHRIRRPQPRKEVVVRKEAISGN